MDSPPEATMPLIGEQGRTSAFLVLSALPSRSGSGANIVVREREEEPRELERVEVVEGQEYRFALKWVTPAPASWSLEPGEKFSPDDARGLEGRFRPGLATGRMPIRLVMGGRSVAETAVEVRSLKLDYLDEYRWMIEDLVRIGSDLVIQNFAAAEQRLRVEPGLDSKSAYQRFCFLREILRSDRVRSALSWIARRPYVRWTEEVTLAGTERGLRADRHAARALARAGARRPNPWSPRPATLPLEVEHRSARETVDNVPNRFVKFVLEEWHAEISALRDAIDPQAEQGPARRARIDTAELIEDLDELLRSPFLRDVRRLTAPPGADQVLQRASGYRDVYEAFVLSRFAAELSWDASDDVFGAGQRNVAALYEYWVYLQILEALRELSGGELDVRGIFDANGSGAQLQLRRGVASSASCRVRSAELPLRIVASFNREFRRGTPGGTWTRTMRPDCTLEIVADHPGAPPVRIHFDAKYRVADAQELLGDPEALDVARANPADLLKMHAYRDAIVHAAGAYVVYPGARDEHSTQFHEVLPGLGAFALRPCREGTPEGRRHLVAFLHEVMEHVASQATQRARATFWSGRAYGGPPQDRITGARRRGNVRWLSRPPADTVVLLGYVKSDDHLRWVLEQRLYNVRADERSGAITAGGPELAAEAIVLYGPSLDDRVSIHRVVGSPRVFSGRELDARGYRAARGAAYFCFEISTEQVDAPPWLDRHVVERVRLRISPGAPFGAPVATTWMDVLADMGDTSAV